MRADAVAIISGDRTVVEECGQLDLPGAIAKFREVAAARHVAPQGDSRSLTIRIGKEDLEIAPDEEGRGFTAEVCLRRSGQSAGPFRRSEFFLLNDISPAAAELILARFYELPGVVRSGWFQAQARLSRSRADSGDSESLLRGLTGSMVHGFAAAAILTAPMLIVASRLYGRPPSATRPAIALVAGMAVYVFLERRHELTWRTIAARVLWLLASSIAVTGFVIATRLLRAETLSGVEWAVVGCGIAVALALTVISRRRKAAGSAA